MQIIKVYFNVVQEKESVEMITDWLEELFSHKFIAIDSEFWAKG